MKKKQYIKPTIREIISPMETLLNGGSIVDANGSTQDALDSDTSTGGTEGDGGFIWADAKQNTWDALEDE